MKYLESSRILSFVVGIKISTLVDKKAWKELKDLSQETHQSLTGLLSEAIREYVDRKRVRPAFLKHAEKSIEENETLGRLLSR